LIKNSFCQVSPIDDICFILNSKANSIYFLSKYLLPKKNKYKVAQKAEKIKDTFYSIQFVFTGAVHKKEK